MHKIMTVALVCLLAAGCSNEAEYKTEQRIDLVCSEDSEEKRAQFILQCLENANPKSDEEPEDWIYQCRKMAEQTYCESKPVVVERMKPPNSYWRDIKVTPVGG